MEKTGSSGRRLTRGRWGAAFAATLLVAACGGGSDPSSDSGGDLASARMLTTEATAAGAPAEGSSSPSCLNRVNNTFSKLLECVTLAGVRRHQQALQTIADENNGIRTSGTPGYDASVDYAAQVLRDAGYLVTVTDFQFQTFITLSATVLEQVSPGPVGPLANTIMEYSGSGDVTDVRLAFRADGLHFRWRTAGARVGAVSPKPKIARVSGRSSSRASEATGT